MNHRVRTIVEEARKLTPEERRELFDSVLLNRIAVRRHLSMPRT